MVSRDIADKEARKVPYWPRHGSSDWYFEVPVSSVAVLHTTTYGLTVKLP